MKPAKKPVIARVIYGVLLCLLVLLQFRLWVAEDGFGGMTRLLKQVALQRSENAELELRNERLDAEVTDLKRGYEAVEERARSDLGLIGPGESFYVFGDSEPADGVAASN